MGGDTLHLRLAAGVVDQQRQAQTDHEDIAGRQHAREQRYQHREEQRGVGPEQTRAFQCKLLGAWLMQISAGFHQYPFVPTLAGGDTALLTPTQQRRQGYQQHHTDTLDGDQRTPQLGDLDAGHGRGTAQRSGPGQHVEDTGADRQQQQHQVGAHAQLLVQRQQGGNGEQEGGGAGAVEVRQHADHRSGHGHRDHVAAGEPDHAADQRAEQPGVLQYAKKGDGKHEHGGNRRHAADAIGEETGNRLRAKARGQSAEQRHHDQWQNRRHAPDKQQHNQAADGQQANQGQQTAFSSFSCKARERRVRRLRGEPFKNL